MTENELVYSPVEHIPIGEAVDLPGGGHGIRLKWKRGKRTVSETIPLDKLHELIVLKTHSPAIRDPRFVGTHSL